MSQTYGISISNNILKQYFFIFQGDSGGPLIVYRSSNKTELVGVTSFTHIYGCESRNPGGFHRVSSSIGFIKSVAGIYP